MQPVLVELLLWPTASSQALVVDTTRATAAEQPSTSSSGDKDASSEVLEALWNILCKSGDLVNRCVYVCVALFFSALYLSISVAIGALISLWTCGSILILMSVGLCYTATHTFYRGFYFYLHLYGKVALNIFK
jgi:hypothetical protein